MSEAFRISTPLRLGLAAVLLVLVPLVAAMLVALQARLALRRGPRWPSRFFWLPLLAVAVLTADVAAGSTGHLWIGVAGGGALGSVLVLLVGVPSRDVLRQPRERSDRAPEPAEAPAARNPDQDPDRWAGARPPAGRGPTPTLLAAALPTARPRVPTPPPLAGAAGSVAAPRFRVIHRLGSGGFGRVWLAHDNRLGHQVALKAAHAPDAETEQRIQREARALAAIRHPHCVRIHDLLPAATDPGLRELDGLVIVMEYVDGQSLGDWCGPAACSTTSLRRGCGRASAGRWTPRTRSG